MAQTDRWTALDSLRGLSLIGMVLALSPGAWEHQFDQLVHVKWQGWHLVDMVSPTFLFCVGAAIPFSLRQRWKARVTRTRMIGPILMRGCLLAVIGFLLAAYPQFDWAHARIPGVLQRIGICYAIVALLLLFAAQTDGRDLRPRLPVAVATAAVIFFLYWSLLQFVPVPGFGAPRYDPVGSWPAYVDRSLFTTTHMFPWWPVDGKVVFDPDGLVSCLSCTFTVLMGAIATLVHEQIKPSRPILIAAVTGIAMIGLAVLIDPVYPIIKNIWTGSFALFSAGFSLVTLALVMLAERLGAQAAFFPARVYGANAILAYMLLWLGMPLLDLAWLPASPGPVSIRYGSQLALSPFMSDNWASLTFAILYVVVLFFPMWLLYRRRWLLKL